MPTCDSKYSWKVEATDTGTVFLLPSSGSVNSLGFFVYNLPRLHHPHHNTHSCPHHHPALFLLLPLLFPFRFQWFLLRVQFLPLPAEFHLRHLRFLQEQDLPSISSLIRCSNCAVGTCNNFINWICCGDNFSKSFCDNLWLSTGRSFKKQTTIARCQQEEMLFYIRNLLKLNYGLH